MWRAIRDIALSIVAVVAVVVAAMAVPFILALSAYLAVILLLGVLGLGIYAYLHDLRLEEESKNDPTDHQ